MIIHEMDQRTPEWDEVRRGKITASVASKLVTPTGRRSAQATKEVGRIIAEKMGWQEPEFIDPTYWMRRGTELEPEARGWFQVETGIVVSEVGFIEHSSGLAGFSPDGIYYDDGQLIPVEFKCPKPSTHLEWLVNMPAIPAQHLPQCHFALAITGAPYMQFMSYHDEAPCLLHRVERNKMTETMIDALDEFYDELDSAFVKITGEKLFPGTASRVVSKSTQEKDMRSKA